MFHVLDDSLLLAQAAIGMGNGIPVEPAKIVKGWVIPSACSAWEFEVEQLDASQQRSRITCRLVKEHNLRTFGGWNRAQFAVIELAILYSRVGILDKAEILGSIPSLEILVQKTAGPRELEAWNLLNGALRDRLGKN